MNQLQVFNYQNNEVRTVMVNNEPWWVAKDVCDVLELGDAHKAVSRLDEDERNSIPVTDAIGRNQNTWAVNEPGLYSLIMGSRKPEAKAFKRWVTHEVLPQIRKTGGYIKVEEGDTDDAIVAKALIIAHRTIENKDKLIAEMKPKAEFHDAIIGSPDTIDMGQVAKVLNMGIGRNTLFERLREKGVLMRNNEPFQKYVDKGWFRLVESKYQKPNGDTCINIKTVVFQKGVNEIRKMLNQEQYES